MKTDKMPVFVTDLLLAVCLLTRIPMPQLPQHAFENGARAVWAYPVAGALVGAVALAGGALAMAIGLPAMVAAGLVLALLALTTGAMHEDGLADTADGFWGAQTAEERLVIMKDSQIGTYGTLALLLIVGLRWAAYAALLISGPITTVIVAAAVSRSMMPLVMATLPQARMSGLSHSVGKPGKGAVLAGMLIAFILSATLIGSSALPAITAAGFAALSVCWIAHHKISGQTGDVLGATQQLSETATLLTLVVAMT